MCGISGILHLDGKPASEIMLKNMTDAIQHRGPDDEGCWNEANVGIGHRRLSILDLSVAGHQPMISNDKRYVLSYNGEIYNHFELRTKLKSRGYFFKSTSDTEVLLYAFIEWREDVLLKLNGMFAFAIWDRSKKEMFLARDRFGVKPLYYGFWGSTFLFASEIKSILAHTDAVTAINKHALVEYFTFQNFFTENTLHKNVSILPAGSFIHIPYGAKQIPKPKTYWDYNFSEPEMCLSKQDYIDELERLMSQAVRRQ